MNTKTMGKFSTLNADALATIEGGTDWGAVGKGAVYGAGIGISMCAAGGVFTGGATWALTAGCAWAGAKLGGAFTVIADNIWR